MAEPVQSSAKAPGKMAQNVTISLMGFASAISLLLGGCGEIVNAGGPSAALPVLSSVGQIDGRLVKFYKFPWKAGAVHPEAYLKDVIERYCTTDLAYDCDHTKFIYAYAGNGKDDVLIFTVEGEKISRDKKSPDIVITRSEIRIQDKKILVFREDAIDQNGNIRR